EQGRGDLGFPRLGQGAVAHDPARASAAREEVTRGSRELGRDPGLRVARAIGSATMNSLFVGMIAGAFGVGYFVYGKQQKKLVPMLAGVLLCVYPYFTENLFWLISIGAALLAAPFLIEF